jgi:hypothetical protein
VLPVSSQPVPFLVIFHSSYNLNVLMNCVPLGSQCLRTMNAQYEMYLL